MIKNYNWGDVISLYLILLIYVYHWRIESGSILCVFYVNFLTNAVCETEISIKVYKNILKQKQKNNIEAAWPLKREPLDN